tara:strand:- start:406 stop:585 length:180 start_codon:yes stop_codon:yes gene_type:complete
MFQYYGKLIAFKQVLGKLVLVVVLVDISFNSRKIVPDVPVTAFISGDVISPPPFPQITS